MRFRFLIILYSNIILTLSYADYDCFKSLPGARVLDYSSSESGYEPLAISNTEDNCKKCKKIYSSDENIISCMMEKLKDQEQIYQDYMDNVVYQGLFQSQGKRKPSKEVLKKYTQEYLTRCPNINWKTIMSQKGEDFGKWHDSFNECIEKVLCAKVANKSECINDANYQSQFVGIPAMMVYQSKLIQEGIVSSQGMSFEESVIVASPKRKRSKVSKMIPVSPEKIIQQSEIAEKRKAKITQVVQDATRRQMGCPVGVEYNLEKGKYICIKPTETRPEIFVNHMKQLESIVNDFLYSDLTSFAAKKVWESYSLSILMDPKISEVPCSKGEEVSLSMINDLIGLDTYMGSQTNPAFGISRLNQCFQSKLNLGNRVGDLAKTVYNMRCKRKTRKLEGPCAKEANDRGKSKDNHIKLFTKRAKDLNRLDEKMKHLLEGKLYLGDKLVSCGNKPCSDFFEWLKDCAPSYPIIKGCRSPDLLNHDEKLAYSLMNNLKDTKELILNKNPELTAKLPYGKNGKVEEVYKSIHPKRKYSKRKIEYRLNDALRISRQKKLDLVMNEMCDDPKDFAQNLLLSNPNLVNEFIESSKNPDAGKLLCVGLSQAEKEKAGEQRLKSAAQFGVMLLGAAMALPTGGASLLYTTAAAVTAGSVGLVAYDLKNALTRLKREKGMFHGCVGEYSKIAQAEEELDDAAFWAAIEVGLAPTALIGLSSISKAKELQKLAKSSKAIQRSRPRFIKKINKVIDKLKGTPTKQRAIIAKEYKLKDLPGLVGRKGRLTKEGRKTVAQIQELERFGFSRSSINNLLRNCK